MYYNEYQLNEEAIENAIAHSPDWIKEDIKEILAKSDSIIHLNAHVIVQLYKRYTSTLTQIATAMTQYTEWAPISQNRLSFIDNNVDIILFMIQKYKKVKQSNL